MAICIPHQIVKLLPRLNPIYPTSSQVTNITRLVVLCLINFCYILQPQTTWPNLSQRWQLDMVKTITPNGVDVFLDNAAWAICSTYHIVLKASPGAAIFGRDMLFGILFIADWNKIGDYRQHQTNLNAARKKNKRVNYDYKVGNKVLLAQEGILCKAESPYSKKPWTITTIYTNGTIRIQCGTQLEKLNIRRVIPFVEE